MSKKWGYLVVLCLFERIFFLFMGRKIVCNVPDCRYSCASVQDYECHYNSLHRYSCGECKKTLPNGHLLDLHLSESHDSYFAAQVAAGKRPMVI